MHLIDLIKDKYNIISVVGMSKNAGKTVTLNELLYEAVENNIVVGLTSIGRDGEKQDIVTCTEKPMIYVNEGTFIATAESLFNCSEAKLEILEITDCNTPLGKIILSKAITPGYVEIAGPSTNKEINYVSREMLKYGAELVIVDGALDRISSASPTITEATVLSTGAVLSRDMNKVIEKTIHRVNLFNIHEEYDLVLREIAERAFENKKVTIIDNRFKYRELDIKTALNAGKTIGNELDEDSVMVVIPGSFVTKTALDMISMNKFYKNITILVRDATKIFIEYRDWLYLDKIGMTGKVLDKINILAVTVNPYSPQGYYFDPVMFRDKMAKYLKTVPVIDVMEGCEV